MADNINISFGKIANALKSVATDHILGVATDIYDEDKQKYQSELNSDIGKVIQTVAINNASYPLLLSPSGQTTTTTTTSYFDSGVCLNPSTNTISANVSGYAAHISGGLKGSMPYQTDNNTTTMLGIGTTGQVLKVNSSGVPAWMNEYSYTLPAATTGALGGIKIGYAENGQNYPVELDDNKAYVNVPWTDTKNTAGSTNNASKIYLIGATSQATNPQTYSNSKIYATDGVLTTEGGINLYKSTGDSPALTFLRGATADDLVDWRMFVGTGVLKIQNQATTGGWKDVLSLASPNSPTITSSYNISPSTNGTLDLGSSSYKWRNIYGSLKGNADTATNVTNVYESKIKWGNNNIAGGLSPIDVALDSQWSANRLSFMPADDILVEYSIDGGVAWEDYGLTDAQKQSLVTTGLSTTIHPGKNSTRQKTTDMVRVTITAAANKTYFSLKKIYSYLSTSGANGTKVKIEKSMCGSDTTFVDVGDYSVSGWSGWNSIPLAASFGGGDNQTGNVRKLRLTFYFTSYGNNYGETDDKNAVKFQISKISMIGETSWSNSGGSLSATGHLYSYDVNKTATFPAALKATAIYENGAALSSKYALQKATSDNFGGIQLGYSQSGKNYPVQLSNGKAYVNVPWTDTDTDTKNTTGATNSVSKMYLIGALSQDANPQTYSSSNVYATNGELTATKFNGGLNGISATSVNNCNGDKLLKYFTLSGCTATEATGNKRYAGTADSYGFHVSNNANGLLWLGNHSTNYGHQLGFSSDGKIYHRSITNGSFPTTANGGSWKTIAFTSDIPSIPGVATTSSNGLMSATDKSKLDNIVAATNEEIDNLF